MRFVDSWITLGAVALLAIVGCAPAEDAGSDGDENAEEELRKGAAEQWVYNGTLPHLEEPAITVSLTVHTARVTGYLPAGWDQPVPYYADKLAVGSRTKIAVVYPIATGTSVNAQGTSYEIHRVSPWVPTNSSASWGGFPFIPYNNGIAFHGPITATDGQWKLIRGPVSHGCNRMQGEHVTELAHLIGVDMTTKVYTGAGITGLDVPVTVLRKPDTWKDQLVDVDYPARPSVTRPTGANVKMFPSWSADQLKAFVCPLVKRDATGGKIPAGYCSRNNQNAFDPATGPSGPR
jgi:hypothetical protein